MTAEEWKKAENSLMYIGDQIKMKIDGYEVGIIVVPDKPLRNTLMVYVDGKFNLKWLIEDCEIRRKFCQKHKKSLLSAQEKMKVKKLKKETRDKILQKINYYYYENIWSSFRSMKTHFIKNNNSIELL